jgi:hypothetical protein
MTNHDSYEDRPALKIGFNRLTPSRSRRRQSRRTGIYDNADAFGWALNEHSPIN